MEIIAFVAGVNHYSEYNELPSAQADAEEISSLFNRLQYKVYSSIDQTYENAYKVFCDFSEDLFNHPYDGAIFYFAGHGAQVIYDDCLLFVDAPRERGVAGGDLRSKSFKVKDVVNEMRMKYDNHFDIIILDCCRDGRGAGQTDLAINQAPFQTLFAYATTSGDKARTNTSTNHGYFTEAFLNHFDSETDIESILKKVRADVYNGSGKLSWVHTCLINEIKLTPGIEACFFDRPYSRNSYYDKNYVGSTDDINNAIVSMRVLNYYRQNNGISLFKTNKGASTADDQFVYGRNLWQSAVGGCFKAQEELTTVSIKSYSVGEKNHVLNGILHEIYFDSSNALRDRIKGLSLIKRLVPIINDRSFEDSKKYIKDLLDEVGDRVYFRIDKSISYTVILNLKDTYSEDELGNHVYKVSSIIYNKKDILPNMNWYLSGMNKSDVRDLVSRTIQIPKEFINLGGTNIAETDIIIQ